MSKPYYVTLLANICTVNLISLLLEQGNNTEEALSVNTSLNRTNGSEGTVNIEFGNQ